MKQATERVIPGRIRQRRILLILIFGCCRCCLVLPLLFDSTILVSIRWHSSEERGERGLEVCLRWNSIQFWRALNLHPFTEK